MVVAAAPVGLSRKGRDACQFFTCCFPCSSSDSNSLRTHFGLQSALGIVWLKQNFAPMCNLAKPPTFLFSTTLVLSNILAYFAFFMIQGKKQSSPGTHPSRAQPYFASQRPELHLDGCRRCARLMVGSSS